MDSFDESAFQEDDFEVLVIRANPRNIVVCHRQSPVKAPKKQPPKTE
jgi:hypothetical protein